MDDEVILLDEFSVPLHGLRVYRVERYDSATILWTTHDAVLSYLRSLQAKRLTIVERAR